MNRTTVSAVVLILVAAGCKAEFKPTGVIFQENGVEGDLVAGEDTPLPPEDMIMPPADTTPDVPQGPKSCEELWRCVLDQNCPLAPEVDKDVCLQKCVGTQKDWHVQKFEELKQCAASACATEPDGSAVAQCAFQHCTDKWLSCVADGDGHKTCGDMHRCLIKDCGPDYDSADCVSSCLREGDQGADQLLAGVTTCTNMLYFAAAPRECTAAMAACYAGSGDGKKQCREVVTCEIGCASTTATAPSSAASSSACSTACGTSISTNWTACASCSNAW